MKNFVKENWYKLMIGCSMFIFSISALIYSVAPARANVQEKTPLVKSSGSYFQFVLLGPDGNTYGLPIGNRGDRYSDWQKVY